MAQYGLYGAIVRHSLSMPEVLTRTTQQQQQQQQLKRKRTERNDDDQQQEEEAEEAEGGRDGDDDDGRGESNSEQATGEHASRSPQPKSAECSQGPAWLLGMHLKSLEISGRAAKLRARDAHQPAGSSPEVANAGANSDSSAAKRCSIFASVNAMLEAPEEPAPAGPKPQQLHGHQPADRLAGPARRPQAQPNRRRLTKAAAQRLVDLRQRQLIVEGAHEAASGSGRRRLQQAQSAASAELERPACPQAAELALASSFGMARDFQPAHNQAPPEQVAGPQQQQQQQQQAPGALFARSSLDHLLGPYLAAAAAAAAAAAVSSANCQPQAQTPAQSHAGPPFWWPAASVQPQPQLTSGAYPMQAGPASGAHCNQPLGAYQLLAAAMGRPPSAGQDMQPQQQQQHWLNEWMQRYMLQAQAQRMAHEQQHQVAVASRAQSMELDLDHLQQQQQQQVAEAEACGPRARRTRNNFKDVANLVELDQFEVEQQAETSGPQLESAREERARAPSAISLVGDTNEQRKLQAASSGAHSKCATVGPSAPTTSGPDGPHLGADGC